MLFSSECFPTHKSIITIFINKFCNKLNIACTHTTHENMNLPIFDKHKRNERKIFHLNVRIQSEENFITQRKLSRFSFRSVHAMSENSISSSSATSKIKKKREAEWEKEWENIMKNSFRRMYNSFHTWNIYSIHADMAATTFSLLLVLLF